MEPRLSIVTLGVADVARSRAFYEALGFTASAASQPSITFLAAGGVVLALYSRTELAADAMAPDTGGNAFSGVTLAHNCRSEDEVDTVLAEACRCGATLRKPGQKVFWGGYSGYFADPDGHIWEVAYNPFVSMRDDGRLALP